MAVGFAKDGAEQLEIMAVVEAAVQHARNQLGDSTTESLKHCQDCFKPIPERRRELVKGCKYCIDCQTEYDTIFKRDPRNCWHRSMRQGITSLFYYFSTVTYRYIYAPCGLVVVMGYIMPVLPGGVNNYFDVIILKKYLHSTDKSV